MEELSTCNWIIRNKEFFYDKVILTWDTSYWEKELLKEYIVVVKQKRTRELSQLTMDKTKP